jgi:hypothetical protein
MSRFYAELHDRELLAQAETILAELQRRNLLDVMLPLKDCGSQEMTRNIVFPRRLAHIAQERGKLKLVVEENFFH